MSEPIKRFDFYYLNDFNDDYPAFFRESADGEYVSFEDYAAIEREVAALRERAERGSMQTMAEGRMDRLVVGNEPVPIDPIEHRNFVAERIIQRIADLEAERAALMSAGKALLHPPIHDGYAVAASQAVFLETPGALAAWMAREGR